MLTKDDMLVALYDAITEDQEFGVGRRDCRCHGGFPQPFDLVAPHIRTHC